MKKYSRVISFVGQSGSGKSYLANVAGEISGIPVFNHEQVFDDVLGNPAVRLLMEMKMREKYVGGTSAKSFVEKNCRQVSRAEMLLVSSVLNALFKRKIDPFAPLIVSARAQPLLQIAKYFGQHNLIVGDQDLRFAQISARDHVPKEIAAKKVSIFENFLDYDKFKYENVWYNNYKGLPAGFEAYAEGLRELC